MFEMALVSHFTFKREVTCITLISSYAGLTDQSKGNQALNRRMRLLDISKQETVYVTKYTIVVVTIRLITFSKK
jgi:hypothetical protein